MEMNSYLHAPAAYFLGKGPLVPIGWVGPRTGLDLKRNMLCRCVIFLTTSRPRRALVSTVMLRRFLWRQ